MSCDAQAVSGFNHSFESLTLCAVHYVRYDRNNLINGNGHMSKHISKGREGRGEEQAKMKEEDWEGGARSR